MHTKFYANPNRFGHSNSDLNSGSSDFQLLELFFNKCESNLKLTCLNTFTRHISIQSTYSKSSHEFIQHKSIQTWLLSYFSIQTSHSKQHCIFIQFNQLICTQMNEINQGYTLISLWSSIASFNSIICMPPNNFNKSP